jgi:hypothetical protein
MGACSIACRGAFSGRRAFIFRSEGDGEDASMAGAVVETLLGCQSLPCGNSAAVAMLCVWRSHKLVANVALISSIRQPLSHMDGGSP